MRGIELCAAPIFWHLVLQTMSTVIVLFVYLNSISYNQLMPFDIGIGILLGLRLGPLDSTLANAAIGALLVLLPDFDLIIYYFLRWTRLFGFYKKLRDHRELFHYPLIYIFLGILVLYFISPSLIPLFIAASLAQFLHDSFGIGWGIPWIYPLSKKYFKFFYQYDLHRAKQPQKIIWVWSKQEQNKLSDRYGDKKWHKHTFQIREYAMWWHVGEIIVLLVALTVLLNNL